MRRTSAFRTGWLSGVSSALVASFLAAGVVAPPAFADVPPANAPARPAMDPQVTKLLQDADAAIKAGNINLALIQLKNAVRLAPQNGAVRAQLAVALVLHNEPDTAEREFRQARSDNGPLDVVIPGILQAMLLRGKAKEILAEFPDPPADAKDKISADILKARAMSYQGLGDSKAAAAAMDRSLAIVRDPTNLRARAQLARQQNDDALANRLIDEALKLQPNYAEAQLLKIALLRAANKLPEALALANQMVKSSPRVGRAIRIEILFDMKEDAKAKEDIDAMQKEMPGVPLTVYYQALLQARANDLKGAWALAVTLPPEFVQSQPSIAMMVAQIALSAGNLESAGQILTTLVSRSPNLKQARLQLAMIRLRQNSPRSALAMLDPVKGQNDAQVQAVLAQVYLSLRRYDDATNALEKAIAVAGGKGDLLKTQLALTEMQAGNSNQGLKDLRELAGRDPANLTTNASLMAALVQAGRAEEALAVADRLAKASPKSPLPVFYRAQILAQEGKLADATAAFTQVLAVDPKFVPALYYRANLSAARGNTDQAKKDLQAVLGVDAGNILADIRLAEIAMDEGRDADSLSLLNQAVKAAPDNPAPHLALANYYVAKGNYADAEAAVNGLLRVSKDNPDGMALLGRIQFLRGNKEEALNTFRTLAANNPQASGPQVLLAETLSAAGDKIAAEAAARKAFELAPDSAQMAGVLVTFQLAAGKNDAALATARSFSATKPGVDADLLVGDTLAQLRRTDEAAAFLRKSFAVRPDGRVAPKLSQLALANRDAKGAMKALTDGLAKNPNDADLRRNYGELLLGMGDTAGARKEFEAILKQHPEDAIALNNLGWIVQKENPTRAIEMVTLAAKIAPRSPEVVDTLGWLKLQNQDEKGALPLLQRAHALKVNDPQIGYHLAVALDASGKRAEAKALLSSILAKNAKFDGAEEAKQLMARW